MLKGKMACLYSSIMTQETHQDYQPLMTSVYKEVTPLTEENCLYVIARKKDSFDFPIHTHDVLELNYVEGASGAFCVVGDSMREITDYELVLISDTDLPHGWLNGNMKPDGMVSEITIQFAGETLSGSLLNKIQFRSVRRMLELGRNGISFSVATILKVRSLLHSLANETKGFYMMTTFLNLLYELSLDPEMEVLSGKSVERVEMKGTSKRVSQVCDYIERNYAGPITLKDVSEVACMSESAFSRFFKAGTGKNISNYIIDLRISKACRELINTNKTISEICFSTGFNNISNFNRQFKKSKGRSPKDFRELYRKKHVLV